MCADIYRTPKPNTFLLLPRGGSLGVVPRDLLGTLGHPVFLNTRDLSDPMLSVETATVQEQLASQGFAVREI